ncbi:MAG: ATP-binding cassette domain-containing protein [Planctomycetes bacterium]|nr:ATP-binding cassette domain-containing protein [Planctomycetota bacterium]
MAQITIQELTIGYRGPTLLDAVSARIDRGEKIGLLGRNGSGKTTLLRLLAGIEVPDSGCIEMEPGTVVSWVPQDVPEGIEETIEQVISTGLPEELSLPEHEWKKEQVLDRTCSQLELQRNADFSKLSTGLKRRTLLGRALVSSPDVLLLDEPTNHLDIDAITWLEGFLATIPATLIFVTHDRAFLTKLAKRILEIDRGKLFDWVCDYPTFLDRKEQALLAQEKQDALFEKRLAEEEAWIRTGIKARRTRNEGRVRRLEEMRRVRSQRPSKVGSMKLSIDSGERSGMLVCDLQQAAFGYGQQVIVPPLDLTIMRGDKIGILGRNGVGKSTLLKGLLGQLAPISGAVRLGTKLEIAYFDQTRDILDPDKTAEENVGVGRTTITVGGKSKHVIGYLQDFLFTPEQARSKIQFFSGGQRNRLLLAKLFAQSANLLVMDEPTNDLDAESLELLEERLVEYEGTLLVVSHDRAFLNNVVTSMLVFEGTGIKEYVGGYDDWLRQKSSPVKSPTFSAATPATKPKPITSAGGTVRAESTGKKLSYKEKQELDGLPAKIEELESEQSSLHGKMGEPDYFKQAATILANDQTRLSEIERLLDQALLRWEELSERDG